MPELLNPAAGCLWLDDHRYASKLLANDLAPVLSVADYVAFRRQSASLLASDVVPISLDILCKAWLDEYPELVANMAAKQRAVAPLRAMLGTESLRAHLTGTLTALRQAFLRQPLVVVLPSPKAWADITHRLVGLDDLAIGQAEADKAAVYVAEFLRAFADCELDGILLVEDANAQAASAEEIAWYEPVFNVASHFRWKAGVMLPGDQLPNEFPAGVDFVVAHSPNEAITTFVMQPSSLWIDDSAVANQAGRLTYCEIPQNAKPERVLAVIDNLREGHAA